MRTSSAKYTHGPVLSVKIYIYCIYTHIQNTIYILEKHTNEVMCCSSSMKILAFQPAFDFAVVFDKSSRENGQAVAFWIDLYKYFSFFSSSYAKIN